uniref:C2H2-type domain-containing protein n=1 Tax=Sphaeramia orbicularis TaxID=375764 RepID=A0A673BAD6_9TELE
MSAKTVILTTDSSDTEDSDEPESGFYHHTGGKPFRCAVCQKRFRYKNNVKRHMTTHTGEKPFTCSICGTKFARKSHLYDHHTARHTGVKPFTCSLCRKQFGCANNYKKHMRRHTAEGRPMKHNYILSFPCLCSRSVQSHALRVRVQVL